MFFFILICSLKGGFITLEDYAFVDLILFISKAFFLSQFSHFCFWVHLLNSRFCILFCAWLLRQYRGKKRNLCFKLHFFLYLRPETSLHIA